MIVQEVKRARAVGASLVAIATADQPHAVERLREGINGGAPLILWDCARGLQSLNEEGAAELARVQNPSSARTIPAALIPALGFVEKTVVIAMNAQRFIEGPVESQAIMNCRDAFKVNKRTLILLGPDFKFPPELATDILQIDERLPDEKQIGDIVGKLFEENGVTISPELVEHATNALRGLAAFPIEQAAALSVKKAPDGAGRIVDISELWDRKRKMIRQTKGLTMETGGAETFDDMGGLEQKKRFQRRKFTGKRKPRVLVFIDEIDKAFAGLGSGGQGDTSGTTQDQLGVLLDEMETRKYNGFIAVGPPGSGKSMIVRAIGATFDVPILKLDLGAAKGSLVGQSEERIRAAMKAIHAIAADHGAYFVATCNRLTAIPAELKRRFRDGLWFFDLPDADERDSIARIQARAAELDEDKAAAYFRAMEGWSGANIRDACQKAYEFDCDIEEACSYIVPAYSQDPEGVDALRAMADGKFLSAGQAGKYKAPTIAHVKPTVAKTNGSRRIALEEMN